MGGSLQKTTLRLEVRFRNLYVMCEMCVCGVRNDHGLDGGYRVLHRRGGTQEGTLWVGAWAEPGGLCAHIVGAWVRGCVHGWCAWVGARMVCGWARGCLVE